MSEIDTNETKSLLQAEGVTKGYRIGRKRIEVLHGVDLAVGSGDFLAIHGASGAGKSTLLHVLGGLDVPDSGSVSFRGQALKKLRRSRLSAFRNQEVGFIFQAYHLFPEFNAVENVGLPARIARRPVERVKDEAVALLEKVGLGDRLDHRPYELSGGEQQRVGIARALINSPAILLADEPTGNLDSVTGKEITALLERLRADLDIALVLATHDLSIGDRADRVVHLRDGKIESDDAV